MTVPTINSAGLVRRSVRDKKRNVCSIDMQMDAIQKSLGQEILGSKGKIKDGFYPEGYWFVEDGVSGGRTDREALAHIKQLALEKKIQRIYVWDYDRFSRNTSYALKYLEELLQIKVMVVSTIGAIDYRTEAGWQMLTMKFSSGQYEREMGSRRTYEVMNDKAGHGYWCGGNHYGYDLLEDGGLGEPNKQQAEVVAYLFDAYSNGTTIRQMQDALKERHIPSPGGKPVWNPKSILKVISNPVFCGYIYYAGTFSKGAHKPIVTVEVWNAVQKKRQENTKNTVTPKPTIVHINSKFRVPRATEKVRLFTIDANDSKICPLT